jgi:alkylhydroperoxidase family enzyme
MARIKGVTKETAAPELRGIFEEQEKQYGAPLNTLRIYALRPTIYKGAQALAQGIRDSGLIAPELKHLVCVKAAGINGCPY